MSNLTTVTNRPHQRKVAIIAGTSLIIMAIVAGFSYGFVHDRLVAQDDPSNTFSNIVLSNSLFLAGIFGWLIILITDIIVAWAIYIYLEPINKPLAILSGWLRLSYSAILAVAILNLIFVLILANNADYLSLVVETEQLQALMMFFLKAFESIWSIGLIIFGGHLFVVGYVAFRSLHISKIISILLLLASLGYLFIHLFKVFLPQYTGFIAGLNLVFFIPMIVGELGFGIWLLIRGGKPLKLS